MLLLIDIIVLQYSAHCHPILTTPAIPPAHVRSDDIVLQNVQIVVLPSLPVQKRYYLLSYASIPNTMLMQYEYIQTEQLQLY